MAAASGSPLLGLALDLAWRQPQLLLDHASACAELAGAEADLAWQHARRQFLWSTMATAGLVLAATLAGTAVMLWAALPTGSLPHPQWLWAVPLPPLLLGLVGLVRARRPSPALFGLLRHQLADDLRRLRATTRPAPSP